MYQVITTQSESGFASVTPVKTWATTVPGRFTPQRQKWASTPGPRLNKLLNTEKPIEKTAKKEQGTNLQQFIKSLRRIRKQHSTGNWDGYGAHPISIPVVRDAEQFIRMLPAPSKLPEITPVPDGDIAFEWYGKNRTLFFVTFHGNRTVEYLGTFGNGNKVAGRETLDERVPENILNYINRIDFTYI